MSSLICFKDLIYNLYELLVRIYLEWDVANQQLVCQDANRPNIDLLVILLPFQDLWTDVEGCATKCAT